MPGRGLEVLRRLVNAASNDGAVAHRLRAVDELVQRELYSLDGAPLASRDGKSRRRATAHDRRPRRCRGVPRQWVGTAKRFRRLRRPSHREACHCRAPAHHPRRFSTTVASSRTSVLFASMGVTEAPTRTIDERDLAPAIARRIRLSNPPFASQSRDPESPLHAQASALSSASDRASRESDRVSWARRARRLRTRGSEVSRDEPGSSTITTQSVLRERLTPVLGRQSHHRGRSRRSILRDHGRSRPRSWTAARRPASRAPARRGPA